MAPRTGRHVQRNEEPGEADQHSVRGPTSALTSFLREQGIRAPPRRPAPIPEAPAQDPTQGNSEAGSSSTATTRVTLTSAESHEQVAESSTTGKKRKQPAAKKGKKEAKKAAKDDDGDGENDFDLPPPKKGKYDDRAPGAISVCGECGKKFTVTKYTPSNPSGPGLLCAKCANEGVGDVFAKKPAPKKAPKKKAFKPIDEADYRPVKTLQQNCISVVGKHIDNVEALGDVGPKNLDKIAKIVCKHRALSNDNLRLFLDVGHTSLTLYDCTNVSEEQLASLPAFVPHLESIDLRMCGRLDDEVIKAWAKGFPHLKHVSLYGSFLVTAGQWQQFFEQKPNLETFRLQQSARFNDDCIKALLEHSPNLSSLQLSEIGRLTNESLELLGNFKNLTHLDISRAGVDQGNVLEDDAVVALLESVGENLHELVLDQNYLLTDRALLEGVKIHCPRVRHLSLKMLREIQSAGFEALFSDWINTGLQSLNVHRCLLLENEAVELMLAHSGHSLVSLDLHSVDEIDDKPLYMLAQSCPRLETLDVSFVRAVDNFVIKAFIDGLPKLKALFVHGNNRITSDAPQKRGLVIRGLENQKYAEL